MNTMPTATKPRPVSKKRQREIDAEHARCARLLAILPTGERTYLVSRGTGNGEVVLKVRAIGGANAARAAERAVGRGVATKEDMIEAAKKAYDQSSARDDKYRKQGFIPGKKKGKR